LTQFDPACSKRSAYTGNALRRPVIVERDACDHSEAAVAKVEGGSQFTTGGAENPTLTILTLAIRQSGYIADQMAKNEI
jgi:hypothetical protein